MKINFNPEKVVRDKSLKKKEKNMPKSQTKKSGHPKKKGGRAKRSKAKRGY